MSQPKVAYQAAWVVGCRILGIGSTLASNIVVARLLKPEGLGAFLLATTVLSFGVILALSGLSEAGLRLISENLGLHRERNALAYLRTTMRWACISSVVVTAIIVIFLLLGLQFSIYSKLTPTTIALIGLGVVVLAWQQLMAQLLRSFNDLRAASFFSGGQTGGPLSNIIFLIPLLMAFYWLIPITDIQVIGLLVGSIVVTLPLAFWELSRSGRTLFAAASAVERVPLLSTERRELASVAASLLGIQVLAFVTVQSDIWIGSLMLVPHELGLYGAAKRTQLIAHMPLQMALMTIQATIPRLYAQERIEDLENRYRTAITYAAMPATIGIVIFACFPAAVLTILFGDEFAAASNIVPPLFVGLAALVFLGSPADILTMTGNHRLVLRINMLSAIALVVGGIVGAYFAGALGLAIGSSIAAFAQNVLLWWIAKKKLGVWTHLKLIPWRLLNQPKPPTSSLVGEIVRHKPKDANAS